MSKSKSKSKRKPSDPAAAALAAKIRQLKKADVALVYIDGVVCYAQGGAPVQAD
jgi:hypothetical protein